jgi:hypothetical protein
MLFSLEGHLPVLVPKSLAPTGPKRSLRGSQRRNRLKRKLLVFEDELIATYGTKCEQAWRNFRMSGRTVVASLAFTSSARTQTVVRTSSCLQPDCIC